MQLLLVQDQPKKHDSLAKVEALSVAMVAQLPQLPSLMDPLMDLVRGN